MSQRHSCTHRPSFLSHSRPRSNKGACLCQLPRCALWAWVNYTNPELCVCFVWMTQRTFHNRKSPSKFLFKDIYYLLSIYILSFTCKDILFITVRVPANFCSRILLKNVYLSAISASPAALARHSFHSFPTFFWFKDVAQAEYVYQSTSHAAPARQRHSFHFSPAPHLFQQWQPLQQ
jgi:hypothetical protein